MYEYRVIGQGKGGHPRLFIEDLAEGDGVYGADDGADEMRVNVAVDCE